MNTTPDNRPTLSGDRYTGSADDQGREILLRLAMNLSELGSWECDLDGRALSLSGRAAEIYRLSRGGPSLGSYFDIVHPDDREQIASEYRAVGSSGAQDFSFSHRIIRGDGSTGYVRAAGARHRRMGRETVIGVVQDISSFKLAEEQLRRQNQQHRFAGRLVKLGSWRFSVGQSHVWWDEQTTAIHDEIAGFIPSVETAVSYYIPEHRGRIRGKFESCVSAGFPFDEVLQIVSASGRRVWVRALGEAVRNEAGRVVAVEGVFQDVSDLIEAHDAAAELSDRLRNTLESMSDAFFLLDDSWCFAFANSQAETLLQRDKGSLIGNNIWDVFPEAVGSEFQAQYLNAVREKKAIRFQEYFPPYKTWFEVSAHPTVAGLAVYFRDITLQRSRDAQLRLLEAAVSRLNDILLITEAEPIAGPDGPKIVYVNDAFERRTGFRREEVLGKTPRILQGPRTQPEELDRIRGALQRWRPVRSELINYTKSGEEFWLELDIVPLADERGWFTHWIAIERDISDRKEVELALRFNEERFRLVSRAAGCVIWDWDVKTGHQWWSEGMQDLFGHELTAPELGASLWRRHVHPDDLLGIEAATQRMISGEELVQREKYRFQRSDGSWAIVEDYSFALFNDAGEVARVLGSMMDVTEREQLEERLRQSQKMEAVGLLTGGVAHDFNNLLAIIMGNAEILENSLRALPPLRKLATVALDAAERGAELVNQLLAFSRRQALEPRPLNVVQLMGKMDALLRRTLPENVEMKVLRSGEVWNIETDSAQLESALLNLVVNARDAMPGGGCITIEMANCTFDEHCAAADSDLKSGEYVMIAVLDTGHGMTAEVVRRAFEPFFTTKESGRGSGLGLSMVYGFVKQSGGHIRIWSEEGKGTAVRCYYPRCAADFEQRSPDCANAEMRGGTETVLVVEDDDAVRQHVTTLLSSLGYRVLQAARGTEALEIMRGPHTIDLLFTDVVMPGGMGGRDLAIEAKILRLGLKTLFTSGYPENSLAHNGRLDPGISLLSKPYKREQLAAKIRNVLHKG